MRYARNVRFQIKSGEERQLNDLFEREVLPILRKLPGFEEEVTLLNSKGAHFISLWNSKENADAYGKSIYPGILAKLKSLIVGKAIVETFETASIFVRT